MFTFTVTRAAGDDINLPITVNFLVGGTAVYPTDYTVSGATSFSAAAGSILLPAGQVSASFTITPVPDAIIEADETIILTPQAQSGVFVIGSGSAWTATIVNDDVTTAIILQLDFEGANNSTSFVDSSPANRSISVVGAAKITTANFIDGTSSGSFDGNSSYLSVPSSTDFDFGANSFSISLKVKTSESAPYKTLLSRRGSSGFGTGSWVIYNNAGVVEVWLADYSQATYFLAAAGTNISDGFSHVVEFKRVANTWQLKIDNMLIASATNTLSIAAAAHGLRVASDPSSAVYDFTGLIDTLLIAI